MTVSFQNIVKSYNGIVIFKNISGKINDGDKVGLIGVNGVGKTSLIKILLNLEEYDSGTIEYLPEDIKIGYLKQFSNFDDNTTVIKILNNFTHTMTTSNNFNNYSKKFKKALLELGLKETDMRKTFSKLSGGEKTKLSLCMVLSENPDMLVLDEPTNHLDVESIKWLEKFISSINKTILIISHDRLFLDNTVNKIFEMKNNHLKEYSGNYTAFKSQKDSKTKALQNKLKKQTREINKLKKNIEQTKQWFHRAEKKEKKRSDLPSKHMRATSKKHHNSIMSKLEKLNKLKSREVQIPKDDISAAYEIFNKISCNYDKLPKYLIKVNRLKKSFGNRVIFDKVSFNIRKNDKVSLIGINGSGKTTLLKILLGLEKADSGTVSINPSLKIGYFSQELEGLDIDNTIIQEIKECGVDKAEARSILAAFLFKNDKLTNKISNLSMGEKSRVVFAKLLTYGCNMLILDEPTNHMDIVSRENIQDVLKNFKGTILFVSHDRYFTKSIASRIFEIEKHKINCFEGDYNYYLEKKNELQMKNKVGEKYNSIKDDIVKLECEMAYLSSLLGKQLLPKEEKDEILDKFFLTSEKLSKFKNIINNA